MVVLGVAVDEETRLLQMICSEMPRSRHPLLLIDRNDGAQRSVFLRILHRSQNLRNADAVVAAEARAIRRQSLLRADELDWIFERIVDYTRLRDADHVHVPLQDRARRSLASLRRGEFRDDVQHLVLRHRAADLLEPFLQIVADGFLMSRGARNVRQCLKLRNDRLQ